MRKTGKVIDFTPYEAVKDKEGNEVISKADGQRVMKRTVVVDCSHENEDGEEVREAFVCDMYRDYADEQLEQLRQSGKKVAFYIFMDYYRSADGKYFQKVNLRNIRSLTT
ncbi:MAG: hypothetical protein Q4D33_12710 [Prevotellaceae bacterium]|nr:hypothetical protein [Prevotellaceae bacterium]